jgi:hypothetical protein
MSECELCLDTEGICGHTRCPKCKDFYHECAGCDGDYCECSEPQWVEGANGITYCSQYCADRYGQENE